MEQMDNGPRPVAVTTSKEGKGVKWRRIVFMIIALLCLIGMGVNAIVNLAVSGTLSWSLHPILTNAFALVLITPLLSKRSSFVLWLASFTVFTPIYLFFLDTITPEPSWFIGLAMPIYATSIVSIWVCFFISKRLKSGWYIAALIVFVSGVIVSTVTNLMILDFSNQLFPISIISSYISIISTAVTCTIVSIVLFCVGYKRKQRFVHGN